MKPNDKGCNWRKKINKMIIKKKQIAIQKIKTKLDIKNK